VRKRTAALLFLGIVLALVAGTLSVLATPWAGRELCALAASRVRAASGLEVSAGACRVRPLGLELELDALRVGPAAAPVFEADAVAVRLAPVQAFGSSGSRCASSRSWTARSTSRSTAAA
jgi:translocation and assembly module TamB